jgi:hypothetical protein
VSRTAASAAFSKDATGGLSIRFIVIMAALASVATAVFLAQVLSPTSFLSAVRGVEIKAISRAQWDEMYQSLRSRLSTEPVARKHDAIARLLALLIEVERGRQPAADVLPTAKSYLDADSDNLVSRLTYAILEDRQSAAAGGAARPPTDRFAAIKRIVDAEPRANVSRLYNEEFTQAWHEVLKLHFKRADVAASLTTSLDHFQIVDHYAALPMIQQQIAAIAAGLRKEGHTAEAETCTRWLGRMMLGLIDSEKDAGTRLLCADLMAKSVGQVDIHMELSDFRTVYKKQAIASLPDPVHLYRAPAVCSNVYRCVWSWGFAFGAAFLTAVGAMLSVAAGCVAALLRRKRQTGSSDLAVIHRADVVKSAAMSFVFVAILEYVYVCRFAFGIFSTSWGVQVCSATISLGALFVTLSCFVNWPPKGRTATIHLTVIFFLMAMLLILGASVPVATNRFLRPLDLKLGVAKIAIVVAGLLVIVSGWLSPVRPKLFASVAISVWTIASFLALASLQVHHRVDEQYQRDVAAARLDEFSNRLGPDWQDHYLKSARAAYDISKP